ncbi:MAG: hypothetical protein WBQ10_08410 [Terriglobales bacterium]
MKKWWWAGRLTAVLSVACGIAAWVTGCSRQLAVPVSGGTADASQLPFDRVSDNSGISPTSGLADGIPVGTEFTVRLQLALSSADSRVGDSFQAVLDEPVVVAGRTVLPRGTLFTGNVVAAKASGGPQDPGYLRMTLVSMAVDGKSIALQTFSIFAKGGSYKKRRAPTVNSSQADGRAEVAESAVNSRSGSDSFFLPSQGDIRFSTGHRFTFRLAQPLHRLG